MTEREKMPAGELYDCGDPELLERWHLAKDLIKQYNALPSGDLKTTSGRLRRKCLDYRAVFFRLWRKYFYRKSL